MKNPTRNNPQSIKVNSLAPQKLPPGMQNIPLLAPPSGVAAPFGKPAIPQGGPDGLPSLPGLQPSINNAPSGGGKPKMKKI